MKVVEVKPITNFDCKDWLLNKHYAKRIPPIEYPFGLFISGILSGVVTYGTPVSSTLRMLWKGEYKLMELNRLVVNDNLPKNTLSMFVSKSLSMLPKPMVIVSYADTSQNHNGYIYQATNFYYTGLSAEFKDYYVKGMEHLHNGTIMDLSRGQENRVEWLRQKFGDNLIMIDRPRKHRYFIFIGSKTQKKDMLKKMPYSVFPYPKGENKRYDSSYLPTVQATLF